MNVMPGGGISEENMAEVAESSNIKTLHCQLIFFQLSSTKQVFLFLPILFCPAKTLAGWQVMETTRAVEYHASARERRDSLMEWRNPACILGG